MLIIDFLILLLAIPAGYLIAWMARDELKKGRKYFRILVIVSILTGIYSYLTGYYAISWTCWFILIISLISLVKSKDKKWAVDRII